jgi:dipeptidyl aminopeptidase/acylaminoacyl peptidase
MVVARAVLAISALVVFRVGYTGQSITSSKIVETREITSVSVAPDGALAVVGICHANPRINKMELSWVIVPLHGEGKPITLSAGEEISDPAAPGALLSQQVRWSLNGKWFFYLRRDGEEVQLWETASNGKLTRQVTHSKSDLIGLAPSTDPNELIVQLTPERDRLNKAEEEEDRNGILYDDHIIGAFPLSETLPVIDRWRNVRHTDSGKWLPPGWNGTTDAIFDTRRRTLTTRRSAARASTSIGSEVAKYRVTTIALGQIPADDPQLYHGQFTLQLESKTEAKQVVKCTMAECIANRITILGWSRDASEIYYLADSLSGRLGKRLPGRAAIYAWNPFGNSLRLVHESEGRLYNLDATWGLTLVPAPLVGQAIVVAFSSADQPPRLEAINLVSGASRVLFDPNSELRALTQGRATWHSWPTTSGYPGRGIIVLPDDYQPGLRYPAVVTSYGCGDGFLRGGSGDNVPEFVAAHHGLVAVCVDISVREILALESDHSKLYAIMCSILTSLIAEQTKSGSFDPTRVGLSGQSLGANFGAYCISHSNEFAAAAFRHGSAIERVRWDLFDTAAWRRDPVVGMYAVFDMPDPHNDPTGKWDQVSVVRRARNINTPTLLEADDTEYLTTLPLWSAMHEEGKPVEMHVFPKETHLLRQPAHRLANYEQQLDWFLFWLKHEEDPDAAKRDQYVRWNKLRGSL